MSAQLGNTGSVPLDEMPVGLVVGCSVPLLLFWVAYTVFAFRNKSEPHTDFDAEGNVNLESTGAKSRHVPIDETDVAYTRGASNKPAAQAEPPTTRGTVKNSDAELGQPRLQVPLLNRENQSPPRFGGIPVIDDVSVVGSPLRIAQNRHAGIGGLSPIGPGSPGYHNATAVDASAVFGTSLHAALERSRSQQPGRSPSPLAARAPSPPQHHGASASFGASAPVANPFARIERERLAAEEYRRQQAALADHWGVQRGMAHDTSL
jgi:hypothetical protein